MRVAVIGAGYWGKKHIEEYTALGHEVVIYDSDPNIKSTVPYKSILSDKTIQAVSICTPNITHYRISNEMLSAGKHVFVEKPISLTVHETVALITSSKINQSVLSVGHLYRFNNAINETKSILPELGDLRLIKFNWTNPEPVFNGRDILFDLAPHPFDIINYLLSKNPTIVSCIGKPYRTPEIEMAFINGIIDNTIVNIELSWLTPPKTRTMTIVGSNKSVVVDCVKQIVTVFDNDGTYRLNIIPNNTIRDELDAFISCIENGTPNIADGIAGLNTVKCIQDSYLKMYR